MTEPLTTKGRLIGKILTDWCSKKQYENKHIHFNKALCSGSQNIRFVSDNINSVFPQNEFPDGYILCYEILNINETVEFILILHKQHMGKRLLKTYSELLTALDMSDNDKDEIVLKNGMFQKKQIVYHR